MKRLLIGGPRHGEVIESGRGDAAIRFAEARNWPIAFHGHMYAQPVSPVAAFDTITYTLQRVPFMGEWIEVLVCNEDKGMTQVTVQSYLRDYVRGLVDKDLATRTATYV
jgi:hypothetical protein